MSPAIVTSAALVWSVFLGFAESNAVMTRVFGDPPPPPRGPVPLARAFLIARLALLLVAAMVLGHTVRWWLLPGGERAAVAALMLMLGYLVGEALPKALGRLAPDLAAASVPWARASVLPFRPLIGIVAAADRFCHRAFAGRREPAGELGESEQEMLAGVHSLADTTVADVMTPRLDITAVDGTVTWPELLEQIRRSDHSRLPVFQESLDDLIGLLHVKDVAPKVVSRHEPPDDWHTLLRPLRYVPEAKSLADQLRDFQRGTTHLAIVVDEFGGTSGLITLEDILEEIVGEIHDEHDLHETPPVEQEGDDRFWVDGRLPVDDLADLLGIPLAHEDVSTVGGLILAELGHVPRPGEELQLNGFRVVVEQVARRRIHRVYFERLERGEVGAHGSAESEA